MKKTLAFFWVFQFAVFFSGAVFAGAEEWESAEKLEFSRCWARSGEISLTSVAGETDTQLLHFKGSADFCSHSSRKWDVRSGEIYEMTCEMKTSGKGNAGISVILENDTETTNWTYGSSGIQNETNGEFRTLTTRFIIPPGRTAMTPRVVGAAYSGEYAVCFRNYTLRKVGEITIPETAEETVLENETLKVAFENVGGTFRVLDKRSGRSWIPADTAQTFYVQDVKTDTNSLEFTALNAQTVKEFSGKLTLDPEKPELCVTVSGDPQQELPSALPYPPAFQSEENDRIILPINEGISFPVTEKAPGTHSMITYGGHGLCMAFWGQFEEAFAADAGSDPDAVNQAGEIVGKSGYLAIIETSDDARVSVSENTPLSVQLSWDAQMKKLGHARTVRYVFFEKAGVTELAKRYRQYADSIGLVVPFTEKIRRNPKLKEGMERLIGAANIWYLGGNKLRVYRELQSMGVKKILASAGGSAEEIREMNAMPGVLTSRYDIYQDSMDPANFPLLNGKHSDWTSEAWERDELMTDANGDWIRGWGVSQKDKTKPRIPCGVLCDMCAVPYERERVGKELQTKEYRARFIDTTTASPWRECWHPKHPCTRTESKKAKMELLAVLGREFDLVTGSETGHEASVPFCDFYEGMMSLGPYRVPDSGRNIAEIWDEAPEKVQKYQVGEAYRLPLWELVYHDCTVSYWYWGDYNNKLPELWKKRDLFNALYGVPPMYLFTQGNYERFKDQIAASYPIAQPVSEMTGWHEMTDFRILSKNRTVQQTQFANGVRVTVNFGELDFTMKDGFVLKAKTSRIEK